MLTFEMTANISNVCTLADPTVKILKFSDESSFIGLIHVNKDKSSSFTVSDARQGVNLKSWLDFPNHAGSLTRARKSCLQQCKDYEVESTSDKGLKR